VNDPVALARAAGLAVEVADLGDWGAAALVAEYDRAARAIRVNRRVLEREEALRGTSARAGLFLHAIAHELYHHAVAEGAIAARRVRRDDECAADAFARALCAR
jgi:hypothetical protein